MEGWSLEKVVYGIDYKKDQGNGEEDEEDKTINLDYASMVLGVHGTDHRSPC